MSNQKKSLKLILHPGYPKCGSSSIQFFIDSNIDKLEKQGIYVLNERNLSRKFLEQKSSGRYLSELIKGVYDLKDFEKRLSKLIDELSQTQSDSILISHEGLGLVLPHSSKLMSGGKFASSVTTYRKTNDIHHILSTYFDRTKVILHIRKQDDFLLSSW